MLPRADELVPASEDEPPGCRYSLGLFGCVAILVIGPIGMFVVLYYSTGVLAEFLGLFQ